MIGLAYIRLQKNLTLEEIAAKVGLKKQNVNGWEKGNRPIPKKYLPILSDMLNVSQEYIQKQLSDQEILEYQNLKLVKELKGSEYTFDGEMYDEDTGKYTVVPQVGYDYSLLEEMQKNDSDISKIKMLRKIDNIVSEEDSDDELSQYYYSLVSKQQDRVNIFNRFADLVKNKAVPTTAIKMMIRDLEHRYLDEDWGEF
jgi:transcriptional regulator with XRE-family HTH domain